jgi:hypothetical protein
VGIDEFCDEELNAGDDLIVGIAALFIGLGKLVVTVGEMFDERPGVVVPFRFKGLVTPNSLTSGLFSYLLLITIETLSSSSFICIGFLIK